MSEDAVKLLLNGGGAVGLAMLVHWHLGRVFVELRRLADGIAVLTDRHDRTDGASA